MKVLFTLLSIFSIFITALAQEPGLPNHPMTANGARHINLNNSQGFAFKLFWENPSNAEYNEIYFSQDSNLVASLDPSVLIASGYDSLEVLDSLSLEFAGYLDPHTKYYWRVVEYNPSGYTAGPVWYFISQCYDWSFWMDEFDGDLSDYTLIEQEGASWFISNTNNAGRQAPELEFSSGSAGSSFLILNEFFDLNPDLNPLSFNYSFDLSYGTFTIGIVYSLDEGNTWSVVWQQVVTDDIAAGEIIITVPGENYVKLALFSNNNSSSFGEWYVDGLILNSPLTVPTPPAQIRALASHDSLKVSLNWIPGNVIDPASGYRIQRKNGFPQGNSSYQTIAEVGAAVLSFEDTIVQLNNIYTYRILETSWPGYVTTWSNEATAYVPPIVPVELQNFYAELSGNNVKLNWLTITETNNLGYEIQRRKVSGINGQNEWMKIGFIKGYGTTTEIQNYYYTDKNMVKGIYQYRLKQIDFNGNFEYSNSINVTVDLPKEFYLSQNYPNPFNPETEIEYMVPNDSKVSIKIFDILGNEIATLINDEKPAGNYSLTWNAVNLPSGIYFYELRALPTGGQSGGFIQTKKMVLLK